MQLAELSNGIRLNYRVEGKSGAPWVLMSNSHGTNLTLWDELAESLASRFQILRYDQRGHGATPAPPPPYALTGLVEDAVGLLDHFGIETAHVVGVSMGGGTGLGLALRHADRLRSATLCDCSTGGPRAGSKEWDDRIAIARREGLEPLVQPTIQRWFSAAAVAERNPAVERVAEMIRTTSVDGYVGCANALQGFDFSVGLEQIAIPCLLIAGSEDGPRPVSMNTMHQRIHNSRFAVISGAGHLPNVEQPAAFNRVVGEFLDAVEASRQTSRLAATTRQ